MIIHVPVYIAIDASKRPDYRDRPASETRFVIRFDTDDDSKPIEFAKVYGKAPLRFSPDAGDVFAMALDGSEFRKLIERTKANPVDYCADPAEGERLQEIADAARGAA